MKALRARLASNPLASLIDLALLLLAAWTVTYLVADLRHGSILRSVADVAVLGFYGWVLRRRARGRRASIRGERKALLAAARKMRHRDLWLNRDEHIALTIMRRLPAVELTVVDEEDMRAIEKDGTGTIVATTYIMLRGGADVLRQVDGAAVTVPPGGTAEAVRERKSEWRKWRDAFSIATAASRGLLAPDREELEQVARYLAGAERIGSLDHMPGDDE